MKSTKVCIAIAAAVALEPAAAKHNSGTIANEKEESIGEIIINGQTRHDAGGAHKRRRQEELYQHNKSVESLLNNEYIEETICGISDDRVASNDVRIGRFWGYPYQGVCTAWLVSEDVFVTAGHCVDEEQQANADRGWIVEFNVPRSTSSGRPVFSAAEDRYNVEFEFGIHPMFNVEWFGSDDPTVSLGNDWAVGSLSRNLITDKKAGEQQGCWFNLEYDEPVDQQEIRITGHGVNDPGDEDYVAQTTHTGPYRVISNPSLPNPYILRYATDTTGGNSGGPVINEATGAAIGIHTNAGCKPEGNHNFGMSNHRPMFVSAVSRYLGVADPASDQIRSPVCPGDFPGKPPRESTSSPTRKRTASPTREPMSSPIFQPTVSRGPTLPPVTTPPPSLVIPILSTQSPTFYPSYIPTASPNTPNPTRIEARRKSKSSKRGSSSSKAKKTNQPTRMPTARGKKSSKSTKGSKSNTRSPAYRPTIENGPTSKPTTRAGKSTKSTTSGGTKAEKTLDNMSLCKGEACEMRKRNRKHVVPGTNNGLSSVSVNDQQ